MKSDDVSLQQPDYKSLLTDHNPPFSPPPPPLDSGSPPLSHTSSLITVLFVASHRAVQECFIKLPLTQIIGTNFYLSTLLSAFPFGMTFCIFTHHFFAKKCTLPLPNNNFENSFSRSLILHLPFNEPMPITYFEGPFWDRATNFYEGKGDGSWIWITTVYNSPYRTNSPLTFKFAIV